MLFDGVGVQMRAAGRAGAAAELGQQPFVAAVPVLVAAAVALVERPEFTDLRALLVKHLDFEALPALVEPDSPVLLVGACDVLRGQLQDVQLGARRDRGGVVAGLGGDPEPLSRGEVDGHSYWDGIFSIESARRRLPARKA